MTRLTLSFACGWVDDESLYSWCARYSRNSLCSTRETAAALFGRSGASKFRMAPEGLEHFVGVTRGALGDAATILQSRTLAGAYSVFSSSADRPGKASVPKFVQSGDLRHCGRCEQSDRACLGTAVWRMQHQLPGTLVCLKHFEPLQIAHRRPFSWVLPGDSPSHVARIRGASQLRCHVHAASAMELLYRSEGVSTHDLLAHARILLCEHFRVPDVKRLRPARVQSSWEASALGRWVTQELPGLRCFAPGWITDMVRGRRSDQNPARWSYFIAYLSEVGISSPEAFLAPRAAGGQQLQLWHADSGLPQAVWELLRQPGGFRAAAASLGVAQSTARRWFRRREC